MELKGETLIAAPRERVWAALNDPAVLARCIDGVESLERSADDRFEGKLTAKVGPVRASFTGAVTLSNIDPPNGYTISGEGKGGMAGFAKGSARVRLEDADVGGTTGTLLTYDASSSVGGKLAQLGTRLIEGTARAYAESFFTQLKAEVEGPTAGPAAADAGEAPNVGIGSDAGDAVASIAAAELEPTMTPVGPLPPVNTPAADKEGLPPAVWGTLLAIITALIIIFLLL